MSTSSGELLRTWRQRRHLSQLELAHRTGVSPRHLSFVENGRSRPTSAMLLRLCDQLAVPLREQNRLLIAAGHAPAHPEHRLNEPSMAEANAALEAILTGHLPYPALVLDGGWDIVAANDAVWRLLTGVPETFLEPPVNVLRLSLELRALGGRIRNYDDWKAHLLHRLARLYGLNGDARLGQLLDEFGPPPTPHPSDSSGLVMHFEVEIDGTPLSLISTTTLFGAPQEVTLSELAIEAFYPADEGTRAFLSG